MKFCFQSFALLLIQTGFPVLWDLFAWSDVVADSNVDLVIDLEKSDDDLVKDIVKVLKNSKDTMTEKGEVDLKFLVKNKGEEPKPFVYNFNKDSFSEAEKSYVFPKVIEEIIIVPPSSGNGGLLFVQYLQTVKLLYLRVFLYLF